MPDNRAVRRAELADAEELAAVMGAAFQDDPVSGWLFPDPDERRRLQTGFFRTFVDLALAEGLVVTTTDVAGVTLWFDVDPADGHAADDEQGQPDLSKVIGPAAAERFGILDSIMTREHPPAAHAYLPFVAVAPRHQGHGVGELLLRHRLAELDAAGRPAYLEASCLRNAKLYRRLGFQTMPTALDLPGGPSLYPMWRNPGR